MPVLRVVLVLLSAVTGAAAWGAGATSTWGGSGSGTVRTGGDVDAVGLQSGGKSHLRDLDFADDEGRNLERGALEIDMVMNVGMFKAGAAEFHANEVRAIAEEVHKHEGAILKVILETCLLTPEQIADASVISGKAGADFVKTSTGFSTGGATVEAVRTMAEALASAGLSTGIKASGGIRTLGTALAMIEAGADRLGASAGAAIMAEAEKEGLA